MKEKLQQIFSQEKELVVFTAVVVSLTIILGYIPFGIYLTLLLYLYPVILIIAIIYFIVTKKSELARTYGLALLVYISLSIILSGIMTLGIALSIISTR